MKKTISACTTILVLFGCSNLVVDPSPSAVASNDLTLAIKACDGPLYAGFGVCRVKEGTQIASAWNIVLPKVEGIISGGEVVVRLRDVVKTYGIPKDGIVTVPMTDLYGSKTWEKDDTSIANATAKIRVEQNDGLETVVQAEGQVLIRVLAKDYEPMPLDSGFATWKARCVVNYSSAGRSAVSCE